MSNTAYTIFRREPVEIDGRMVHEIIRRGQCPEYALGSQVREGESILIGQALCDVQHYIERDQDGRKSVGKHSAERVAARAPLGWQPPMDDEKRRLIAQGISPGLAARLALKRRNEALNRAFAQADKAPLRPA